MKLYLGNNQETVLDLDENNEIQIVPINKTVGGVYKIEARNSYRADWWNGKKFISKRVHRREYDYNWSKTKEAVTKIYNDNLILKFNTPIKIKVKDITPQILKYFRYVPDIVDYPEQDVILNPYFIGIWLGDGTSHNTSVTNIDNKVISFLELHSKKYNLPLIKKDNITYYHGNLQNKDNPIIKLLRQLNMLRNKHIPICYLENSIDVRLQLLAGLIDTDGHLQIKHGHQSNTYEILQKNEILTDNIITLSKSLGFFTYTTDKEACATNTKKKTKRNYKRIIIYVSRFTLQIPVKIPYKKYDNEKIKSIHGPIMSLDKKEIKYRNEWTDEMKEQFPILKEKYVVGNGSYSWVNMVKNEKLYKHLTNERLRAYNRSITVKKEFTEEMKDQLLALKQKYVKKDGSYKWTEMAANEPIFTGITASRLRAQDQHMMRYKKNKE